MHRKKTILGISMEQMTVTMIICLYEKKKKELGPLTPKLKLQKL